MTPGYDTPIDEDVRPTGFLSGCLLLYLVGWWVTCAFVTGAVIASYG